MGKKGKKQKKIRFKKPVWGATYNKYLLSLEQAVFADCSIWEGMEKKP